MFKRILFFTKPTKKQIDELNLHIFTEHCYTRIARANVGGDGHVNEILRKAQALKLNCQFIVVDEQQFAAGNGVITSDVIVGGDK